MPPKIFVSSTIYDFRDLRSALKYYYEKLGYEVQLSEFNDFQKDLDSNSYNACLEAIKDSDYFILLIGSRVGGYFDKGAKISITQKEYQIAYELAQRGKLKLLTFVRDEIWNIKEDRKSIEGLIKSEVLSQYEIAEKDIAKIVHHPSSLVNDADHIFNFIDEVCKKNEMRKAIAGEGEFPKNNWVHPFKNFKDITDVLEVEFKLTSSIEELVLAHNLKAELVSNIQKLLKKNGNDVKKSNDWAQFCRNSISKSMKKPSSMPFRYFKWLSMYALVGPGKSDYLRSLFIEKAISSGIYLKYERETTTYKETDFSKYLNILRNSIAELFRIDKLASENAYQFITKYEYLKGTPDDQEVRIENKDILLFLAHYDCIENVLILSMALLDYLNEDLDALQNITLAPISPFEDENEQLKKENLTIDETIDWIESQRSLKKHSAS